jgi:hypothetical protein
MIKLFQDELRKALGTQRRTELWSSKHGTVYGPKQLSYGLRETLILEKMRKKQAERKMVLISNHHEKKNPGKTRADINYYL